MNLIPPFLGMGKAHRVHTVWVLWCVGVVYTVGPAAISRCVAGTPAIPRGHGLGVAPHNTDWEAAVPVGCLAAGLGGQRSAARRDRQILRCSAAPEHSSHVWEGALRSAGPRTEAASPSSINSSVSSTNPRLCCRVVSARAGGRDLEADFYSLGELSFLPGWVPAKRGWLCLGSCWRGTVHLRTVCVPLQAVPALGRSRREVRPLTCPGVWQGP